ncbi:MAG: PEP-CTERM sorting domain-containing protein [Pirellulales bacterium]|nr:PEP-CTERM sorting domain-containing protein [Pirellulales bacterium]
MNRAFTLSLRVTPILAVAATTLFVGVHNCHGVLWDSTTAPAGGDWNTPGNWDGGSEPTSLQTATFTPDQGVDMTITNSGGNEIAKLEHGTASRRVTWNSGGLGSLKINGDGTADNVIFHQLGNSGNIRSTINVGIELGASGMIRQNNSTGEIVINGVISDGGFGYQLTFESTRTGNDRPKLGAANTYSGGTVLNTNNIQIVDDSFGTTGTVNWNNGSGSTNSVIILAADVSLANDFVLGAGHSVEFSRTGSGTTYDFNGAFSGGDSSRFLEIDLGANLSRTVNLNGALTFANTLRVGDVNTVNINSTMSHANIDDTAAGALGGTGSITWNFGDLMDLDQSTLDITNLDLILDGSPSFGTHVIANYASLVGGAFESVTNNTSIGLFSIDYGTGTSDSITVTFIQIPEPTSFALAALGLVSVVVRRKRRVR